MNEDTNIHERTTEKKVSAFLQYYDREKTRKNYRAALYRYFSCVFAADGSATADNTPESLDAAASAYLQEIASGRSVINDLYSAAGSFTGMYAPATANLYIRSVCTWLNDCGVALSRRDRQRIFKKIPPAEPVRREADLTRSLFRAVYNRMNREWARVLLLVLLGSGMRLSEALSLRTSYVSWKKTYTEVYIPASDTKTKRARIVYLTKEASFALKSYLETRETVSEFLFPYTSSAAERQMRRAADSLSSGKNAPRIRPVHWHMTRKWFISRFSLYASRSVAEKLAGHEGYLAGSYHRFTKRQILGQFRKAERYLSILMPSSTPSSAVSSVRPPAPSPAPSSAAPPAPFSAPSARPGNVQSAAPPEKISSAFNYIDSLPEVAPHSRAVHHGCVVHLESGKQVVLLDTGKYIVLNDDVTSEVCLEKGTS